MRVLNFLLDLRKNLGIENRLAMALSLVIPKKKNRIVFGSAHNTFFDNSKYLFLETHDAEIDAVWISDNPSMVSQLKEEGFTSYFSKTFRAKYYCLTAQYAVFNHHYASDLPGWYLVGSEKINLWHGIPYKDILQEENSADTIIETITEKLRDKFYSNDYFLCPNKRYTNLFGNRAKSATPLYAGYPRNDLFKEDIEGSNICTEEISSDFVLYLPTYRGGSEGRDNLPDLTDIVNFHALDRELGEKDLNFKLIVKPHPDMDIEADLKNIQILEKNIDIYPLLKESKALITDYSSVMFDYMHTGKPVIRFAFDKEDYDRERGLNEEIGHLIPGREVKTTTELTEALSNLEEIDTDYEEKLNEVFECRDKENLQYKKILDQIT